MFGSRGGRSDVLGIWGGIGDFGRFWGWEVSGLVRAGRRSLGFRQKRKKEVKVKVTSFFTLGRRG